ncbi:MAG: Stp1/IreP family PP2C-type Ser/Thr phosphatase [Candidatus Zhuqueibacterota bacterium]
MTIKMMAKSDVGVVRPINEDYSGVFEENKLAIVCDGMGGHKGGEQASRLAVSTIRYMYLFLDLAIHQKISKDLAEMNLQIASRIIGSIRLANRNIYNKSIHNQNLRGMGTTVSALSIQGDRVIIAHVGDSRVYRFSQGVMEQITEDHTWVNELIQDQEINADEAKNFIKQNVITRALGQAPTNKIDLFIGPLVPGDTYLLCTDGLTKAISNDEIKSIVFFNNGNMENTLTHLIDTANIKDGSDNVTVALVKIDDSAQPEKSFTPVKVVLKAEAESIGRIEDQILKQEMNTPPGALNSPKRVSRLISSRTFLFSLLVIVLAVILIFALARLRNMRSESSSGVISNDVYANSTPMDEQPPLETPGAKETDTLKKEAAIVSIPDSVLNKLVSNSIQPGPNSSSGNRTHAKTLNATLKNRGVIYLAGFEKSKNVENSALFINNKFWGKTVLFRNSGLQLPPGKYTITIRDSSDQVIFNRSSIEIASGDIKTIQFSR